MTNIKIFVTYKDRHQLIKSDILTPIQTGRAIADEIFEDMIGDDTGDNISTENPKYNELSAQYWVWKNYDKIGNPDYVGFMHYRRHFCFDTSLLSKQEKTWLKYSNVYRLNTIDDEYIKQNFSRAKIENYIQDYDCIVLKPYDVSNLGKKTIREQYGCIPEQQTEIFDIMLTSVAKLFPEYREDIDEFKKSSIQYLCNMFIMRKNDFFEYSNFCFSVLSDINKQIDSTHFTVQELRFCGYVGEFLLSLYIKHKNRKKELKIKELDGFFIENMPYYKEITPVFKNNYSTIGMSCSNEYAAYLAVCLKSLVQHSNPKHNYDILIFECSISGEYKEILKKYIEQPNISLRFITIANQFKDIKIPKCYKEECSYRILAPLLLKNYQKIIWTDCDLIFNEDIADLDKIDCPTSIAACKDFMMNAHYGIKWADWKDYCHKELGIKNIYDYYNIGVIIINIPKYLEENLYQKTLNMLTEKQLKTLEQDALNSVLQNKIVYLDPSWNFCTLQQQMKIWKFLDAMDEETRRLYKKVRNNPKIIHYAATRKPWFYPDEDFADVWWEYARKTPFYEEILKRCILHAVHSENTSYQNNYHTKTTIKLFNFLPIFKKKSGLNKVKYKFLGLPLFKKKNDTNKIKYYFFGIPIWKTKIKGNAKKGYLFGKIPLLKSIYK